MNCPNCQAGIPDGALFCSECGTALSGFTQSAEGVSEEISNSVENSEQPVADKVTESTSDQPEVISGESFEDLSDLDGIEDEVVVDSKSVFTHVETTPPIPVSSEVEKVSEPVSPVVVAAPIVAAAPVTSTAQASSIPTSATLPTQKSKKALMKEEIAKLPKEYRPLSTIRVMLYYIIVSIPVIGALFVLISAFAAKNRNTKSLSRAILAFFIIGLVVALIGVALAAVLIGTDIFDLPGDLVGAGSVEEMLHIVNDFVNSL